MKLYRFIYVLIFLYDFGSPRAEIWLRRSAMVWFSFFLSASKVFTCEHIGRFQSPFALNPQLFCFASFSWSGQWHSIFSNKYKVVGPIAKARIVQIIILFSFHGNDDLAGLARTSSSLIETKTFHMQKTMKFSLLTWWIFSSCAVHFPVNSVITLKNTSGKWWLIRYWSGSTLPKYCQIFVCFSGRIKTKPFPPPSR